MEVGPAAHEDGDELTGASERQPKQRSGVWNKYGDAAAAGIFAAARAAGAMGAGIMYGEVNYKVWFKPHGEEPDEVSAKIKALQLATADARLAESERRTATLTNRAPKAPQREGRQQAAGVGERERALAKAVPYTQLRAHETDYYRVCRLLLEKKKNSRNYKDWNTSRQKLHDK